MARFSFDTWAAGERAAAIAVEIFGETVQIPAEMPALTQLWMSRMETLDQELEIDLDELELGTRKAIDALLGRGQFDRIREAGASDTDVARVVAYCRVAQAGIDLTEVQETMEAVKLAGEAVAPAAGPSQPGMSSTSGT